MTIFQKLRLRSLRKSLLCIILPLILVVLMAMLAVSGFKDMNREPVELYSVPRDELEGAYVTVELPLIYDAYAYSEETVNDIPTGKITSKEYIIDANETDFCGLVLADELVKQGDQLYSDSMKYLTGRLSAVSSTFRVTGVMRAIMGTRLEYYQSSAVSELLGHNTERLLPFYLDAETKTDRSSPFLALGFGLFSLAALVFLTVLPLSGAYQKQLTATVSTLTHGEPEALSQRVAQMAASARKQNGICIDNGLVFLESGLHQYLYKADDIVWAFQKTGKHGFSQSSFLVLGARDGTLIELAMQPAKVQEYLKNILFTMPWCAVGYTALCQAAFSKNRDMLRTVAQAQRSGNTADTGV